MAALYQLPLAIWIRLTHFDIGHLYHVFVIDVVVHRLADFPQSQYNCPHMWPNIALRPYSPKFLPILVKRLRLVSINFCSILISWQNNNNNCASFVQSTPFAPFAQASSYSIVDSWFSFLQLFF